MRFINLLVNRYKENNVISLVENSQSLYIANLSITVEEDLLCEFIKETENTVTLSNNLGNLSKKEKKSVSLDLEKNLIQAGKIFFTQFFPKKVQEYLLENTHNFLFLHITPKLNKIPWELCYAQNCFLSESFYLSKNISHFTKFQKNIQMKFIKMLIIANPTEDLKWVSQEGERLYDYLLSELDQSYISITILRGNIVSKMELLKEISNADIVHYIGHTYINVGTKEIGWFLSADKVLYSREIANLEKVPKIIFSNSCESSHSPNSSINEPKPPFSFVQSGVSNYIGTYWRLEDGESSSDFALYFYYFLFEGKSVGEALFEAKNLICKIKTKNNFTWANYTLYGDPSHCLVQSRRKASYKSSQSRVLFWRIYKNYPLSITQAYREITKNDKKKKERFNSLKRCLEVSVQILSAISFANCRFHNIQLKLHSYSLFDLLEMLKKANQQLDPYKNILTFRYLLDSFHWHEKQIFSLKKWIETIDKNEKECLESHLSGFEYILENFLNDLHPLAYYKLLYIENHDKAILSLNGYQSLPIQDTSPIWKAFSQGDPKSQRPFVFQRKQVYLFHPSKTFLLSLDPYIKYEPKSNELIAFLYE